MDNPTTIRRPRPLEIPKPVQRELFEGTGTYGPAPRFASVPPRPVRIPYNVAFREVLGFVKQAADSDGWGCEAKQRAVSTILDFAAQRGALCLWERK